MVWDSLVGFICHVLFYLVFAVIFVVVGGLIALSHRAHLRALELTDDFDSLVLLPEKTHLKNLFPPGSRFRKDKSNGIMTGSRVVDRFVDTVVGYILRDYVAPWYSTLAYDDQEFQDALRDCSHKIVTNLAVRVRTVDWLTFMTTHLVDDFASHIRLFRKARDKLTAEKLKPNYKERGGESDAEMLESLFFDCEFEMEKKENNKCCREMVAGDPKFEEVYLRDLSDVLLYLLLPPEDFVSKPFRLLLREFFALNVLKPFVDHISQPDYVNHTIVWLLSEIPVTHELFLSVIDSSDSPAELQSVLDCLETEIAKLRSQDTGGEHDFTIKQQLTTLFHMHRLVKERMSGTDSTKKKDKICDLSLEEVLGWHAGLCYFQEFLSNVEDGQYLITLYPEVRAFKVSATQCLSKDQSSPLNSETVKEASGEFYQRYLTNQVVKRLLLDDSALRKIQSRLRNPEPSATIFNELEEKIITKLKEDQFFPAFKRSPNYVKMLAERIPDHTETEHSVSMGEEALILGTDEHMNCDFGDGLTDTTSFLLPDAGDAQISALLTDMTFRNEPASQKAYAVYKVRVTQSVRHNALNEVIAMYDIYRRYSEFAELHRIIEHQFPNLAGISFPGKKTFNNMNKDFLEKRKTALNEFVQIVIHSDMMRHNPGLADVVYAFLDKGDYDPSKKFFGGKMDTFSFMNPLLSGVKSVGNAVVSMPDTFVDGIFKVGDGLGRATKTMLRINNPIGSGLSSSNPSLVQSPIMEGRVGSGIVNSEVDNIPLKIMLKFMDEGSGKSEDVSSSSRYFILLDPRCDLRVLFVTSDQLRLFIGQETTRQGILMVFECLQSDHLNRRLVYVLLEHFISTVFKENKFDELFTRLHSSKSPRCQTD